MPSTLASVVKRTDSLSNEKNRELIHKIGSLMKRTDTSENYRKDNLYVALIYAQYLGRRDLFEVNRKQDIIDFLDTRKRILLSILSKNGFERGMTSFKNQILHALAP